MKMKAQKKNSVSVQPDREQVDQILLQKILTPRFLPVTIEYFGPEKTLFVRPRFPHPIIEMPGLPDRKTRTD
jgi:hypothetical protein